MPKSFSRDAEERSLFLAPVEMLGEKGRKGERADTSPLREARLIDIERIKPDPEQPRKTFLSKTLESLAESIREVGGIIDPLTVEYDEREDCFRIISGERRYRAAKMIGLERLPCIVKAVDEKRRFLLQLICNLQRDDLAPLEECAGIRSLIGRFGYSQARAAKLLNRSPSYISQILGLERLSDPARGYLQTSEVAKEIQIQASKEKDPRKQLEILKEASEGEKTVREIRADGRIAANIHCEKRNNSQSSKTQLGEANLMRKRFRKWAWTSENGRFVITVRFKTKQSEDEKLQIVAAALEEAEEYIKEVLPSFA
jgi:ParB family chromosome partitioning protein